MTRGMWVAMLLLLAVAGCAAERTISGRRDYSIDPTLDYKKVALTRIVADPSAYKGLDVEFDGMFYRREETIWSHYYTPFVPEDYLSFSLWPVDARVWELEGRLQAVPTLYMRKTNEEMQELLAVRPYDRVLITGNLKSDYEGRPWIEVHSVDVIEREVFTQDSLRLLVAGLTDAVENRPAPARERLERAVKGPLSAEARYVAHLTLGRLYEEANDFVRAMSHFGWAEDVRPDDPAATEGYERNQKREERRRQIEEGKEPEEKKPEEKKP